MGRGSWRACDLGSPLVLRWRDDGRVCGGRRRCRTSVCRTHDPCLGSRARSGLGLAVALSLRLPVSAAAGIVGMFALFHGHAHGGELGSAGALAFGAGFAVSTALLHTAGISLALAAGRAIAGFRILQGLGWATTLGGLWVIVGS